MRTEKEHLSEEEVDYFRRRVMSPAQRRGVDAHVATCDDCLEQLIGPEHSSVAFNSLAESFLPSAGEQPFHLSKEELQRYNFADLDEADLIIFESHLEVCPECCAEADVIRAAGALPASIPSGERAEGATKPRREWLSKFWQRPRLWTPARAVGMLAVLVCFTIIVALWIQRRPAQVTDQTVQPKRGEDSAAQPKVEEIAVNNTNGSAPAENNNQGSSNTQAGRQDPAASPNAFRLNDGGTQVSLDRQGRLSGLEKLTPQVQRLIQTTLASEDLPEPHALKELAGPKISLMGGSAEGLPFELLAPVGVVVSGDRPTLRWQPLEGTASYTVSVFDSNFNRVAKSGPQSATEWAVPLSLQAGGVYSWEVTAVRDNQEIRSPVAPAPRAQFKIIEAGLLNEIAGVRKQRPRSHLALGVLYARAGLLTEAEHEFRSLVNDNPRSKVARGFLRTVRRWRSL